MSKRGTAVLDPSEPEYAPETSDRRRSSTMTDPRPRRDTVEDFASSYAEDTDRSSGTKTRQRDAGRRSQLKLRFKSRIPTSLAGRIATGVTLLLIVGAVAGLLMVARSFLLHDPRFMIQSAASIEIQGNKHLTRSQLLGIFGEDVERNIFRISLDDRQAELEALPWVQHATVMRLLPGRIRVALVERTPVAFIRQGGHICLVDGQGVLLDMTAGTAAEKLYSFPVVTGIAAGDPATTRAARMKIFERFTSELDSAGGKISQNLSEVDLSNPEDIKALIPDHTSEVLVHFGDDHFLDRYRKFQELLPQWHTQYPNLASVDMRYEREVVLDMAKPVRPQPDASQPAKQAASKPVTAAKQAPAHPPVAHPKAPAHAPVKAAVKPAVHPAAKPLATNTPPAAAPAQNKAAAAQTPGTGATPASTAPSASAAARASYPAALTVKSSHPAPRPKATPSAPKATPPPAARAHSGKPSAGKPLTPTASYHPPQVPTP